MGHTGYVLVFLFTDLGPVLDVVSVYAVKTDNGKVSCTLCGYVTRDKYNIRMHLEGRHGMSNGYQCDKCSKQLRTKQSITQHRLHCAGPSF